MHEFVLNTQGTVKLGCSIISSTALGINRIMIKFNNECQRDTSKEYSIAISGL